MLTSTPNALPAKNRIIIPVINTINPLTAFIESSLTIYSFFVGKYT